MAQTIKLKRSSVSGRVPTTSDLELGEVAINTYDGKMYIKKSVGGTETVVSVGGGALATSFTLYEYTASASQTTFSGSDSNSNTLAYDIGTPPKILVYLNGVLLDHSTDYTATNGTSVVLTSAAAASDLVQIAAYKSTVTSDQNLDLDDNQKILLGDDDDLQIYHDGTHSYIEDSGTGRLRFKASTQYDFLNGAGTETLANFIENGAIKLYYDNSQKFETTNDGISVTGDVEATGEIIGDLRGATLFKAQAGEALTKGEVVYISGVSGNTTVVSKADADDANKMPAFGLVAASASSGNPVDIYTAGILADIDTSSFSEGDELFVSTTAGALTATAPAGESAALQKIGKVTRSDATGGRIFIIGAGRTNAVPNLNEGRLFVGNSSNQAVADDTVHVDIANSRVGINTTTPSRTFEIHENTTNLTIGEKSGYTPSTYGPVFETNADALVLPQYAYLKGSQAYIRNESSLMRIHGDNGIKFSYYNGSTTTEGMRLDTSGRLGIGTTSPSQALHVAGKIYTSGAGGTGYFEGHRIIFEGTDSYANIGGSAYQISNVTNEGLVFGRTSSRLMTLDTSGRLGIGTSSPGAPLHVNSDTEHQIKIESTASAGASMQLYSGGSYSYTVYQHPNANFRIGAYGGTSFIIRDQGNSADRLAIINNGNVGIGDTSPDYKLHVNSGTTNVVAKFESTDSIAAIQLFDNNGNVELAASGATFRVQPGGGVPVIEASATDIIFNNNGDDVNFRVESDTSPNAFSIDGATGNIGMGTATPDEFGVGSTYKYLAVGGDKPGIINLVDSGTAGSYLQFGTAAGVRRASIHAESSADLAFTLNSSNTGTSLTERVRIKASTGNVGIGITDPDQKLDVNGNIRIPNAGKIVFGSAGASPGDYLELNDVGSSGDLLKLVQDNTTRLAIQGVTGNVSIGVTTPFTVGGTAKLSLSTENNTYLTAGASNSDLIYSRRFSSGHYQTQTYLSNNTGSLELQPYGGKVGVGTSGTVSATFQVEAAGIDTTTTSTTATTQVAIDTFAAATFRSARYTIQVTNSTDSTYHITEILLIHDGTTPQITEYGTIFTGSAEATFDADISSGNVRLLATPATTDSMTFKVVRHCITV